ncbi:MAG: hypothetical protein L0216_17140 [Planctomycetales bacterium]|nr:hypothetical protein [Planctomycetales bacterium]
MRRRVEMLIGCGAFAALGGVFAWRGWRHLAEGTVSIPFVADLGNPWATAAGVAMLAIGGGTVLASALFARARWGAPAGPGPRQPGCP